MTESVKPWIIVEDHCVMTIEALSVDLSNGGLIKSQIDPFYKEYIKSLEEEVTDLRKAVEWLDKELNASISKVYDCTYKEFFLDRGIVVLDMPPRTPRWGS